MKKICLILILIFSFSALADDDELWIGNIGDEEFSQSNFFGDDELGIFLTEPVCGNGICDTGESCSSCSADCGACPGVSGGGGGKISKKTECTKSSDCASDEACINSKCVKVDCRIDNDCKKNQYCLDYECYDYECISDADCKVEQGEVCRDNRCIKLFDILIKKFESPVKIGDFFEFTYLVKGMANISDDVEINFWIEQNGTVLTSGHDTIYISSFEEKIMTAELFLPSTVESGVYSFFVQLEYGAYKVDSHRTIEIIVDEKEGTAVIIEQEEPSVLDWKLILVGVLAGLIVVTLVLIIYFKRIKIKVVKR